MIENFLEEAKSSLPRFATEKDIAKLGLFTAPQLKALRNEGKSCAFIKAKGRYLYFREDILKWIRGLYQQPKAMAK